MLGRYKNQAVAVGGWLSNNKKVEKFENGVWEKKPDFNYVNHNIYYYSMVTLDDELYLFGESFNLIVWFTNLYFAGGSDGQVKDGLDIAVQFLDPNWVSIGRLMHNRYAHRSISIGDSIIHVGGCSDNLDCDELVFSYFKSGRFIFIYQTTWRAYSKWAILELYFVQIFRNMAQDQNRLVQ